MNVNQIAQFFGFQINRLPAAPAVTSSDLLMIQRSNNIVYSCTISQISIAAGTGFQPLLNGNTGYVAVGSGTAGTVNFVQPNVANNPVAQDSGGHISAQTVLPTLGTVGRTLAARSSDVINALDQGVVASAYGTAVDTTATLQAAINLAIANNKTLYIPAAPAGQVYAFTPPLSVSGNIKIVGDYCDEIWGTSNATGANSYNIPTISPYLQGSVLAPVSNGQNAFNVTGAGTCLSIEDLGLVWQTPFVNTGHGVYYLPPAIPAGHDIGLMGATWKNFKMYGHDGNHYLLWLANALYNTYINLRAYGGGLVHQENDNSVLQSGNSVFIHPVNMLIVSGSANCYDFPQAGSIQLQLLTFIRPQAIADGQPYTAGITPSAPTNSQKLMNFGVGTAQIAIVAPDMESTQGSYSTLPTSLVNIDMASGGFGTGYTFASNVTKTYDYMVGGGIVEAGAVTTGGTSGTVTFPKQMHGTISYVTLAGVGITAQLSGTPSNSGFSYTLSAAGTFHWIAFGLA